MTNIFTQAVHAGEGASAPKATPVTTPIYHSVGFVHGSARHMDAVFGGVEPGYVYRRYGSPTVSAFESAMATLEEGDAAFATASGMAAVHAALLAAGVRAGSHVIAASACYGATYALLNTLMAEQGTVTHFMDITDLEQIRAVAQEINPAAIITETVSNPLLTVADVPGLATIAKGVGASLIVDSTFSTPYLCRPLDLGADFVVHSASKYIGGHGDVLAGVVVTSNENRSRLFAIEKMIGAVLAPEVAWLALRGLKTLALRMRQQCANAREISAWLVQHPAVNHVHYPGLAGHAQHALALQQFGTRGFGAMIAFELKEATREAAFRFLDSLQLILPATTLGDVFSLALYPVMASHRAVPPEARAELGITDGLLRLSIGIEGAEDLMEDLNRALST
ncbi:MAG: PLP-dependent aspartate aminotransferase family protein [Chloroflexota bacterium]|nr:PLP-dependent aspartate aminotransferase family protein [Chloroflexota bacterium]